MFVIVLKYVKPLEEIDKWVGAHIEFLKKYYDRSEFICSGPRIPRVGGIILANADSLDAVWKIIQEDPFYIHGVTAYEVIEFTPTRYDPRFASFAVKKE